jgi:hypothetical protein
MTNNNHPPRRNETKNQKLKNRDRIIRVGFEVVFFDLKLK